MRILVAPDSFKGTLSAVDVCRAVDEGIRRTHDDVDVELVPIADGGEGTVDAFVLAAGGQRHRTRVSGPYREAVDAEWAVLPDGTAVVEIAAAAGLPLVGTDRRTHDATTYGVGELIREAARSGAARLVVGLGGSASTDGGCGAAAACGVRFLDAAGTEFVPTGADLTRIARIDTDGLDRTVAKLAIEAMCDVDNPLTGEQGAAAVFGPQKGADPAMVRLLDDGLSHLAEVVRRDLGVDVVATPGAGAAGGLGGGMIAFLGAELRSGVEAVLDVVGFDERLRGAAAVVTGEGSFDAQSFHGKVVQGVARRAQRAGVPVHVLAGRVDDVVQPQLAKHGIVEARAVTPAGMPWSEARRRTAELVTTAAAELSLTSG